MLPFRVSLSPEADIACGLLVLFDIILIVLGPLSPWAAYFFSYIHILDLTSKCLSWLSWRNKVKLNYGGNELGMLGKPPRAERWIFKKKKKKERKLAKAHIPQLLLSVHLISQHRIQKWYSYLWNWISGVSENLSLHISQPRCAQPGIYCCTLRRHTVAPQSTCSSIQNYDTCMLLASSSDWELNFIM